MAVLGRPDEAGPASWDVRFGRRQSPRRMALSSPAGGVRGRVIAGAPSGGRARVCDEPVGVLEARGLHAPGIWRGEHDQLGLCRVSGDVGLNPATHGQMDSLDGRVERAGRMRVGRSCGACVAGCRCARRRARPRGDRRVVDDAAVDQPPLADRDRGKIPGIDADAAMASTAGPSERSSSRPSVRSNATRWSGSRIGEVLKLDVPSDQSPQLAIRDEVIAPTAHAADERLMLSGKTSCR